MVDVLGKLVAHQGANFLVALPSMPVRDGEAFQVWDRLGIPNYNVAHVAHSIRYAFRSPTLRDFHAIPTMGAKRGAGNSPSGSLQLRRSPMIWRPPDRSLVLEALCLGMMN